MHRATSDDITEVLRDVVARETIAAHYIDSRGVALETVMVGTPVEISDGYVKWKVPHHTCVRDEEVNAGIVMEFPGARKRLTWWWEPQVMRPRDTMEATITVSVRCSDLTPEAQLPFVENY